MGSWNHTCSVTHLPIFEGDEVEVIMLQDVNSIAGSSLCYPYSYHVPLPLTFQGRYNDYGGVEDCEGIALDIIVDSIRDKLYEMELGENEYHDIAVKKEGFDVKFMFEADHEDRLGIVNIYNGYENEKPMTKLKHIVVRKEVYDKVVSGMTIYNWDSEAGESSDVGLDYLLEGKGKITSDIDRIISLPSDAFEKVSWMMNSTIGQDTLAGQFLQPTGEYRGSEHPIRLMEVLMKLRENKDEKYDAVLENAIRFSMFRHFIMKSRRSWVIPSGLGSQDEDTLAQRLTAELTLSSAKEIDSRWDEYED